MNIWQNILKTITFGLYNPSKKFEQEVLGEATSNLKNIESLRDDVSNLLREYNNEFKEKQQIVTDIDKVTDLVELEEQLQEQGKYVGMDEETKIKAIMSEARAAQAVKDLEQGVEFGGSVNYSSAEYEAYRIACYDKTMNGESLTSPRECSFKRLMEMTDDAENNPILNTWKEQTDTEKYIAMFLASDRATRQSDGTYLNKTSKEWEKIDKAREKKLRDMPKEELFEQGKSLEESLQERYIEIIQNKKEMQREGILGINSYNLSKFGISEGNER